MTVIAPVITIDGPSSSGKSTLCNAIAKKLHWNLLDSGAIYRILALKALRNHLDFNSESAIVLLAKNLNVCFIYKNSNIRILLEGKDISKKISIQKLDDISSKIALFPRVREALLFFQRSFRKVPGLITNGRDMGTVVFPDAILKVFLDASLNVRANRRMLQLQKNNSNVKFEYIFSDIKKRDERDRNRSISPLMPAKDALILDSTHLTIEQMLKKVLQYVSKSYM